MMGKLFRCLVLFLLSAMLVLASLGTAAAQEKQKIRVGYFHFPGYHEISADGRYSGYGYDVLQMLRFYNNWEYEYVGYDKSWEDMLKMLDRGEIDLVTSARYTPEREHRFLFSGLPVGIKATRLSVRQGDERFVPDVFSTYNGMRVATLRGSSQNELFRDFAAKNGFSCTLVPFDTSEQLEQALKNDYNIDAVLTSNVRYMKGERVLNQFAHQPFYVLVRKGDYKLLSQVDIALEQMNDANPLWFNSLWHKHYDYPREGSGGGLFLTKTEVDYQKQLKDKEFTVMVGIGHAPYSYLQNGEIRGVLPDIFREIAKRAGVKYKLVPVHGYEDYKQQLEKGEVDFILDMPQDRYGAEQAGYLLSTPILQATQFLVQRHSNTGTGGRLAAVQAKRSSEVFQRLAGNFKSVLYYNSFEDCLTAVENGVCDATYLDALQAQEVIANDYQRKLVMTMEPNSAAIYTIGMSERIDPVLRSIINKAIVSTNADYSDKVVGQYLVQANRKITPLSLLYDNPILFLSVLLLVCALLTFVIVMYNRQKNIRVIKKQNRLLGEALARAEQANKAKTSFLNNMSHDIRTPMNSIIGFTSVALDEVEPGSKVQTYLEKINLSGQHLLSLINDVLDMSRIDSGKLQLKPAPSDFIELLHGLKTIVQGSVESKQLKFRIDTQGLQEGYVLCDKLLLQRALLNCLSNAIKYTNPGGTVILKAQQKQLNAELLQYTIQICDNGIGISQEFLQHIYDVFERESNTTMSGINGSGLGMAITKSILTLMGGTIEVKSAKNVGTEVTIQLSLPLTEAPGTLAMNSVTEEQLAIFKGRHILLVDDVALNREIASLILERAGFEVTVLADGMDVVNYMQTKAAASVELILMDLMMPVMDGLEATRRIRSLPDPKLAQVPIVALTASAFEENKKEALAAGMNGHVAKPISLESLYTALKQYFVQK